MGVVDSRTGAYPPHSFATRLCGPRFTGAGSLALPLPMPSSICSRWLAACKALVHSAPHCRVGEPAEPDLRAASSGLCSTTCAIGVGLVRVLRSEHEKGLGPVLTTMAAADLIVVKNISVHR